VEGEDILEPTVSIIAVSLTRSLQLNEPVLVKPAETLAERVGGRGPHFSQFAVKLEPTDTVAEAFPEPPAKHLHVIVQLPLSGAYEWLVASPSPQLMPRRLFADPHWFLVPHSTITTTPSRRLILYCFKLDWFPHCHRRHPRSLLPIPFLIAHCPFRFSPLYYSFHGTPDACLITVR
jgi:hypothetical protein